MKRRVHLKIEGRVQGVFFRAQTQREGKNLGLTGWVRNCSDGSVETVAEGDEEKIKEFTEWCRRGPSRAVVTRVDVEMSEFKDEFLDFEVRY